MQPTNKIVKTLAVVALLAGASIGVSSGVSADDQHGDGNDAEIAWGQQPRENERADEPGESYAPTQSDGPT